MKYVLMFTSNPAVDATLPPEQLEADYQKIYDWFVANGDKIVDGGAELQGVETATTVTFSADGPVVVDGPFSEAKEVIGGFSIIEVDNLDEAIALARTWPSLSIPESSVEIRPMVEDYSQFEQ